MPYRKRDIEERGEPTGGEGIVGDLVRQFADPYAFFRELVQNAIDALRDIDRPRIEVRVDVVDGRARVRVHDNGAGIAPDDLVRVFDPFFTTKPLGQGTGLGLSISYGIVNEHGGRLTAANHVQGGALFTLLLPLEGTA